MIKGNAKGALIILLLMSPEDPGRHNEVTDRLYYYRNGRQLE